MAETVRARLAVEFARIEFRSGRIDAVYGMRLADDRKIVLKLHRPPVGVSALEANQEALGCLARERPPARRVDRHIEDDEIPDTSPLGRLLWQTNVAEPSKMGTSATVASLLLFAEVVRESASSAVTVESPIAVGLRASTRRLSATEPPLADAAGDFLHRRTII